MKTLKITQLIFLLILEINSQNLIHNNNNTSINNERLKIPGYPTTKPNPDDHNNEESSSSPSTNTPNTPTGRATGTSFSEVARNYYGVNGNASVTNNYLQYPEPYSGWEDELCQKSPQQSPINIPYESDFNIIKDGGNVEILSVNYNILESGIIQYQQNHMWGIGILNGGNIRVKIEKNEYTFYLSELYFHLNSEHRLQNKQYPVEMQLVHYIQDYGNNSEKLIISVLYDYSNNKESDLLKELKAGLLQEIQNADFSEVVKRTKPFYYYKGGLTIPPCSNNVHWIVFKDIHNMTYTQFERIKNWIEGSNKYYYNTGYGNARGIKLLNGRKIYYESKLSYYSKSLSNGTIVEINAKSGGKIPKFKFNRMSGLFMIFSLLISLF